MLSIIIITKNEEKCLPRLLESLITQTYKDFEVIVSDAKSTDRTREIATSYDCMIVDGGLPSVGRNNGARMAKGDLLLFLDADVSLPKDFLEKSLEEFHKKEFICAGALFEPISERIFDKILFFGSNLFILAMQHFAPCAGGACIFVKKEIFNQVGRFNEQFITSEDHAFVRECHKIGKFGILRDKHVLLDVRRLEEEGRFKLIVKYAYEWAYKLISKDYSKKIVNYELHGVKNG